MSDHLFVVLMVSFVVILFCLFNSSESGSDIYLFRPSAVMVLHGGPRLSVVFRLSSHWKAQPAVEVRAQQSECVKCVRVVGVAWAPGNPTRWRAWVWEPHSFGTGSALPVHKHWACTRAMGNTQHTNGICRNRTVLSILQCRERKFWNECACTCESPHLLLALVCLSSPWKIWPEMRWALC